MTYVESRNVRLTEEIEQYSLDRSVTVTAWTASLTEAPLFPRTEGHVSLSRSADTAQGALNLLRDAVEEQGWEWRN